MKRKIFSKLLMGALLVASVSSFTSCKDYDDDIKKNTDDISALTKQISTLETALNTTKQEAAANYATKTEIAKLATAEALQKSINDLQAKIQGNSSKTIAELANDIDAINPKLNTLGTTLDDIQKAAQAAIKNIELQQTVLDRLQKEVEGDGSSIAGLKDDVATLKDEVAKVKTVIGSVTSLDELAKKMTELSNKIDDSIDVLTVLVSGTLKSLVFQPDFYVGGVEATEAPVIVYVPLKYGTTVDKTYNKVGVTAAQNIYLAVADDNAKKFEKISDLTSANHQLANTSAWFTDANVLKDQDGNFITLPNGTSITNAALLKVLYPNMIAKYHMNPSTVKKENIKEVSVISDDKIYLTRAAASAPEVKSWDAENGILTAMIGLSYKDVVNNADKMTVFAAQAHYKDAAGDTTITSDYAAIAPSVIAGLTIADNAAAAGKAACPYITGSNRGYHVYTTAATAIAGNPSHEINWNSTGFDLDKVVEVHAYHKLFNINAAKDATSKKEFVATAEQLKNWGFNLKYSLVEYTTGTELTEQTVTHSQLDGSMLKPWGINEHQTNASIGREPLVKVELIDANNGNQLVQIGYIKFKIVAEKASDVNIVMKEGVKYWDCAAIQDKVTWSEAEGKILDNGDIRANGIAKATFELLYGIDGGTANKSIAQETADINANTYIKVGQDWKKASDYACYSATGMSNAANMSSVIKYVWTNTAENRTGTIEYNITSLMVKQILAKKNAKMTKYLDVDGAETNDLSKAALNDEAEFEFAARMYDIAQGGLPDIYVIFKLKVSKLKLTINKIADYWYAKNSQIAKSGYDEIHVNVPAIGETGADITKFEGVLQNSLVGNKFVVDNSNPVVEKSYIVPDVDAAQRTVLSAAGKITTKVQFVTKGTKTADINDAPNGIVKDKTLGEVLTGYSGAKYLVIPKSDGSKLLAYGYTAATKKYDVPAVSVVEITGYEGADLATTTFVVQNNNAAKDLLNVASHKDLENTLTAHVKVSAKTSCASYDNVIVTNPEFDVKFLRPIDIEGNDARIFEDAGTAEDNRLNLLDLIKFNDWREQWAPKFGAEDADLFQKDGDGNIDFTKPLFQGKAKNYYNYYQVTVEFDKTGITTDLNNSDVDSKKLSEITDKLIFNNIKADALGGGETNPIYSRICKLIGSNWDTATSKWTGDVFSTNYGKTWADINTIEYKNNGLTVGEFKVRVPIIVHYYWGDLKAYVYLTVNKTKEN